MPIIKFSVGDTVITKKKHPCSSDRFTVLRTGSDVKLRCLGCQREITKDRVSIERLIKSVLSDTTSDNS